MRWSKRDVIYQILVDRFSPVDSSKAKKPAFAGGNLKGITAKVNYFKELGVSALWLTPIYKGTSYHGYHTTDFMEVDPRFGTLKDFQELIKTYHKHNIKIMLDFVPNHVSSGHPFFHKALAQKKYGFRDWFYLNSKNKYKTFFGQEELPKLNLNNPATRMYIINAAKYWLSMGVDGLRLDHAVGPSIDFWKEFSMKIKKQYPHTFLLGEVWVNNASLEFLKTTNAKNKLCKWISKAKNDSYMKDYQGILDGCIDFTFNELVREFIFDHKDKKEFSKKLIKHYQSFDRKFMLPTFLDNHDMDRFYYTCKHKEEYKKAIKFQFSQHQPTIIYYGNESGMSQQHSMHHYESHGDLQARQPMNWENMDAELVEYYAQKIAQKLRTK